MESDFVYLGRGLLRIAKWLAIACLVFFFFNVVGYWSETHGLLLVGGTYGNPTSYAGGVTVLAMKGFLQTMMVCLIAAILGGVLFAVYYGIMYIGGRRT